MEKLFEKFFRKVDETPIEFKRYLFDKVDWNNRLIGIKGARGVGKTIMLLQYAKMNLPINHQTLYVSLDDFYFSENQLTTLVDTFVKQGGKFLLLDEVHRYKNWSVEIKNIYDDYSGLHIIFTGSSIIHLNRAKGDLSRRAVMYELAGLSYREFLRVKHGFDLPVIDLKQLIGSHTGIAMQITRQLRPLEFFQDYLVFGYYPFFIENHLTYPQKLAATIDLALTTDLPASIDLSYSSIEKLKQLIYILAQCVPFQPNVSKLSERIGVSRNSLVSFLGLLDDLRIIKRVFVPEKSISALQKPDKIMMYHPNLQYSIMADNSDKGSMRESFFVNQVGMERKVYYSKIGDFVIDDKIFEIGGRNKSTKQISGNDNAFVVADDIEIGSGNKIPLWIFGFLY